MIRTPTISLALGLPLALLAGCTEYNIKGGGGTSEEAPADTAIGVLEVDPLEVDFGEVPIGAESAATITVRNVGSSELFLESVDVVDPYGPFSVASLGTPLLTPGASTTFLAVFSPNELGLVSGEVLVESDAPYDGSATVSLLGGTGYPSFTISPEHHDFGELEVGDDDEVDLVITNVGDEVGTISDPVFTSTSESELTMSDLGDLGYVDVTLAPGESTTVTARYAPADDMPDEATFAFSTDAPDQPSLAAILEGTGIEGCEDDVLELVVMLTVDDAWKGWLDGDEFTGTGAGSWTTVDTLTLTSDPGCEHVLAVYGHDNYSVISGFLAAVDVYAGGLPMSYLTGGADWVVTTTEPPDGWTEVDYDDSAWEPAAVCADTSPWGGSPTELVATGAQWVWWDTDCTRLGDAWFRLKLGEEEEEDG